MIESYRKHQRANLAVIDNTVQSKLADKRLRAILSKISSLEKLLDKREFKGARTELSHWQKLRTGLDENIRRWSEERVDDCIVNETLLTDQETFWDQFHQDIENAQKEIMIVSPFAYPKRLTKLKPHLDKARKRNVHVVLVTSTKPCSDIVDRKATLILLKETSSLFAQIENIHQKVAIIDGRVVWEGSLNILSHKGEGENNTREQMRRLTGRKIAQSVIENLNLALRKTA